jgi:hypothetical protein
MDQNNKYHKKLQKVLQTLVAAQAKTSWTTKRRTLTENTDRESDIYIVFKAIKAYIYIYILDFVNKYSLIKVQINNYSTLSLDCDLAYLILLKQISLKKKMIRKIW